MDLYQKMTSPKNIYNDKLYKMAVAKAGLKIRDHKNRIVVEHDVADWDFLTLLAERLMLVAERWMENQEPRTTVYKGSKAFK